jgi:hypothetical protein
MRASRAVSRPTFARSVSARGRRARRARASEPEREPDIEPDTTETTPTTSGRDARAVVLVPGFLSDARAYEDVAVALERSVRRATGARVVVSVARVSLADWAPTLAGGDFARVVDKIDACVREASAEVGGGKVCVVAHSAGRVYAGERFVDVVVTLGAPHASMEKYPFGRIAERRRGEDESTLTEDARGSSLAYANLKYPGAFYESVRYVNVVGDVVAGSPSFDVIGALCDDDDVDVDERGASFFERLRERLRERWSAYVVGVSYAANCGDPSTRGDGVCPVATALSLDGAENVILPGVYHGKNIGDPWYGSPDVVDAWSSYCV